MKKQPKPVGKKSAAKTIRFKREEMAAIKWVMDKYNMDLASTVREVVIRVAREVIPQELRHRLREARFTDPSKNLLDDYRKATIDTGVERLSGTQ